ncbi:MAG: hypothetical protein OES32_06375 [Acidobacteriota bacterium]|nr:hypothetical protein [Acidobacteriota bacterium]MDH3523194.1 hypothetical protein [Acidobacteriota bacterium]
MRRLTTTLAAIGLALCVAPVARAQSAEGEPGQEDLRQEIEALKQGQRQIQRQLREIEQLLKARPAAPAAAPSGPDVRDKIFELGDNPTKGERTAPLTLVDFTDYQ